MDAVLFNLNDARLQLWRGGELLLESPGYALLQGKQYSFGEPARCQARLQPRNIQYRYWQQLDTEPLQPAFGSARHSADLVHSQLLDIHQQLGDISSLIIAAPGSMRTEQLSLLLGIIDQSPFEAVGLVDRAVASCCDLSLAGEACHVELHLNQALVTRVGIENGHLQRLGTTPIPGCGWLAVQEQLAQGIAESFIRQTRFDPRRLGATEQDLYNRLPALLTELSQHREHNLEFSGNQARIERATLAEKCAPLWQRIAAALEPGAELVLAPDLRNQVGLADVLGEGRQLDDTALAVSVDRHREELTAREGDLHFITRLAAAGSADTADAMPVEPQPERAPQQRVELAPEPQPGNFRIEVSNGIATLEPGPVGPTVLNGSEVTTSAPLRPGDTLDLGNGQYLKLLAGTGGDGA